MLSFILFFMLLSSPCLIGAVIYKRKYEDMLPISCMSLILIVFLFGIFGGLKPALSLLALVSIASYIVAIVLLVKAFMKDKKLFSDAINSFFSAGFFIYLLLSLMAVFFNYGRLAHVWDEFSHWMDTVKIMTLSDTFASVGESGAYFRSYPPGMSIFQYIFQKVYQLTNPGEFSEWRCYVAFQMFFIAMLLPLLNLTASRLKNFVAIILWLCALILPLLFFGESYTSIMIDPVLSICYGAAAAYMTIVFKKIDGIKIIYIVEILAVLTLLKDVGFMLAIFLGVVFAIKYIWSRGVSFRNIICGLSGICSAVIAKVLWRFHCQYNDVPMAFSQKIDLGVVYKVLTNQDTSYRRQVLVNYRNAIFGESMLVFGPVKIFMSVMGMAMLLILLMILAVYYSKKSGLLEKKEAIVTIVSSVLIVFSYIAGLCILYMFRFSEYEATNLASINRYLGIVLAGVYIHIFFIIRNVIVNKDNYTWLSMILICMVLLFNPWNILVEYGFKEQLYQGNLMRSQYDILNAEIESQCPKGSIIYLVDQDGSGMDLFIERFCMKDYYFNSGKIESDEEWEKIAESCNYIVEDGILYPVSK